MRRTARRRWSPKSEHDGIVADQHGCNLMKQRLPILAAMVLLATGCKIVPPDTFPRSPEPTGSSEMEILGPPPRREPTPEDLRRPPHFETPAHARRQGKPEYPLEGLSTSQECMARILYHIEVDGSATLVRLEWDPAPGDGFLKLFEDSIREAITGWEFSPSHRLVPTEQPDGSIEPKAVPIKSADRVIIRFSVIEGRGVVE